MVDLTPLPGDAEDGDTVTIDETVPLVEVIYETREARVAAAASFLRVNGGGVTAPSGSQEWAFSHADGDVIQVQGGPGGVAVEYLIILTTANNKLKVTTSYMAQQSRLLGGRKIFVISALEAIEAGQDTGPGTPFDIWEQGVVKLDATRKDLADHDVSIVTEAHIVKVPPGTTFTLINPENLFADAFLTEFRGFIQFYIAVRMHSLNPPDDKYLTMAEVGDDIERRTQVRESHTLIRRWLRPLTPPPAELEAGVEEEGGFGIETDTSLVGQFSDLLGGLGQNIKDFAGIAIIVIGTILAIFLMRTFQAPIKSAAGGLTSFVQESLAR